MRYIIAVLLISIPAISAIAGSYTTGSTIKPFELSDQHDRSFKIDNDTKVIIFVSERQTSNIVHTALQSHDKNFLLSRSAVYIADISKMPSFVNRMFVLPELRKYTYSMLLDKDSKKTSMFPRKKEHVTLIKLDGLKIKSVEFIQRPEAIIKAIDPQLP